MECVRQYSRPPDGFGREVTMLWQRTLLQSPCGVRGEPECHHKNPRCLRRGVVSLDMTDGGEYRSVVGYHPNAPEDRFVSLEEDGYENLYGICLESDKRYLCITAEYPEQIVSRNLDN